MTMKKAGSMKPGTGKGKLKKLALKKETLGDLSAREAQAELVRGQTLKFGTEPRNHNETLVRATPARNARAIS